MRRILCQNVQLQAKKITSHNNNKAFLQKLRTISERKGFSSAFHMLQYQLCCVKIDSALKIIYLRMFQLTQSRVNYDNETPGHTKKPMHQVHAESLCSFECALCACPVIPSAPWLRWLKKNPKTKTQRERTTWTLLTMESPCMCIARPWLPWARLPTLLLTQGLAGCSSRERW